MLVLAIRLYPLFFLGALLGLLSMVLRWFLDAETPAPISVGDLATSVVLTLLFLPSRFPADNALFPLNGPF